MPDSGRHPTLDASIRAFVAGCQSMREKELRSPGFGNASSWKVAICGSGAKPGDHLTAPNKALSGVCTSPNICPTPSSTGVHDFSTDCPRIIHR